MYVTGIEPTLDISNVVDRELFDVKITNPRPIKLHDMTRGASTDKATAQVQVQDRATRAGSIIGSFL